MRLLFAHDHRFHHGPAGEIYTLGSFPAAVWDRYLEHFAAMHVIARSGGPLPPGANLARSDHSGVSFEFLPSLATLRQLLATSGEVSSRMKDAVRAADAVVARLPSEMGLLAIRYARQLGKPYAVEVVGCAWDGFVHHGSPLARLYAPLLFQRMRFAVRSAPFVLYVTSSWLQSRYPTSGITACASNVEIVLFGREERARRETRLKEIAAGRVPRLGTIAALNVRTKGIQTAIAALARLRSNGLQLSYYVLGAGNTQSWERLANDHGVASLVTFDGTRESAAAVRQWLDGLDIYLQPSFQEGLPRATIEAMSRAVACIGSTCGGIPELIGNERTHAPGDDAELADCIQRLATNESALAAASWKDLETSKNYIPELLHERRAEFYAQLRDVAASRRRAV